MASTWPAPGPQPKLLACATFVPHENANLGKNDISPLRRALITQATKKPKTP
jgi:hypothetical protein